MTYLFGALIVILGLTMLIAGGTDNAAALFQTVTGHATSADTATSHAMQQIPAGGARP